MTRERAFEFDHAFVLTAPEAPEAGRLAPLLTEGSRNVHPGQGTANRRFFFRNAMLELLWVRDEAEALADPTVPVRLWRRWSERARGACPFGLCFRPARPGGEGRRTEPSPFGHWDYAPAYLPVGMSIRIGANADLVTEPLLFVLENVRPDARPAGQREPLEHPAGLREVTRIELETPHAAGCSAELQATFEAGLLGLRAGHAFLLELGFDGEAHGRSADLRPALPILLRW